MTEREDHPMDSGSDANSVPRRATRVASAIFLLLVAVYLLLILTGVVASSRRLSTPELALAGGAFAFVVIFDSYTFREFKINPSGFEAKVDRLDRRTIRLDDSLSALRLDVADLFLTSLARTTYEKLAGLVSADQFQYDWSDDLEREMVLLRDLGFVDDFSREDLRRSNNLKTVISASDQGKRFVAARQRLDNSLRAARAIG